MATTIICHLNSRFSLVLDPDEVFPEDPGQGTPAMVYGPDDASGTANCVANVGEMEGRNGIVIVPDNVLAWLQSDEVQDQIEAVWEEGARARVH